MFVPLRGSTDTTALGGKPAFRVSGAVAESERDLILERTMSGLDAARAGGRKGGRRAVVDEGKSRLRRG